MSDNILNPFINLYPDPKDNEKWVLQAPLPGKGLQRLRIDEVRLPGVFDLCGEFGESAVSHLGSSETITEIERAQLVDAGIFIKPEDQPAKPVFSCLLDSLTPVGPTADTDLIVNPTMHFEPFDLSKFRSWAGEMNLSPYLPSVWIRDTQTGLRSGYWVTQEQAGTVATLEGGAPPPDMAVDLRDKLLAAGVIVSRDRFETAAVRREDEIVYAAQRFLAEKYSVVKNAIPKAQVTAMQAFYRDLEAQGFMTLGDDLVPSRFVAPMEPFAGTIHRDLVELMAKLAGQPLKPAYCYAASYLGGAELPQHTDRPQCEYSFSIQIDYRPAPDDGVSPWPLLLSVSGSAKAIHLGGGDCLAYKGCEVPHSRPSLPEGHRSTSLFLHYVPLDFEGELI